MTVVNGSTHLEEDSAQFSQESGEGTSAIPWDHWLQRLEGAKAEPGEWVRAEEFAASVIAVAERKRRISATHTRFYAAFESLAPHSDSICYFEMEEMADWDVADFACEHLPGIARELENLCEKLESWRKRRHDGFLTARQDALAAKDICDTFAHLRGRRDGAARAVGSDFQLDELVRCRRCGSIDLRYSGPQSMWHRLLVTLFGMDGVRCRSCRYRFHTQLLTGDED